MNKSQVKEAIEARALKLADSRLEDERGTYEWSIDAEITLRECAAALAALRSMPAEPVGLPRANSIEASAMIDSVLAAYNWPTNPKNAARAGFEACLKLLATPHTAPLSDAEIEEAVKAARHSSGTLTPTDLARAIERAVLGRGGEK